MQEVNPIHRQEVLNRAKINKKRWKKVWKNWELYLFIAPAFLYFLIFHYGPMYGIQIAFKNYNPARGIFGSAWTGFDHFNRFFDSYYFWDLMWNTLAISLYELAVGFPIPIILALAFNELKHKRFKKMGANGHLRAAFHLHRSGGRHDHCFPVAVHRHRYSFDRMGGHRCTCFSDKPGLVQDGLRSLWRMAERRVGHDHLSCRLVSRRPGPS